VAKLLALGADATLTDKNGNTALMLACENKHDTAVAELMEATKRAGALDLQVKYSKRSALHWASEKGRAGTVAKLLALGADATLIDEWKRSALHLAAHYGHPIIGALVQARADVNAVTSGSAVHGAALGRAKR
jgi:ankyrin repeat protein